MESVTYQTRVPDELIPFCERMGELMSEIERNLYQDLKKERVLKDLKREYGLRVAIAQKVPLSLKLSHSKALEIEFS